MYLWWAILRWILVGLFFGLPEYTAAACGYPGSPAHSYVRFSTDQVIEPGTLATYECEQGFELLGPARRLCHQNGTWTPPGIPFCVLNVAAGKAPMQSSIVGTGVPQKAVDGNSGLFFNADTCTMTEPERAPWWYVNLLEPYLVQLVRVDFGISCCANNRPATIVVRVGNNRPDLGVNPICNKFTGFLEEGRPLFLPCSSPMPGAFVSVHFEGPPGNPLSICETFVYTDQALPMERCPSFPGQPLGSTSTYNGKCYLFYNNHPQNFDSARRFCETRGGTLVDETSPALQGFLSWELYRRHRNDPNGQYWMGAVRDINDRKNWKWINGKDVTISFWNLPGTNENCSRFDGAKGWLWSDTDCNAHLNFICQHRPTKCGAPERAANSSILARNQELEIGSVLEYRCDPGHLLVGPNIRTCLPNGFLSEFPPKCRYLECGSPASITNGGFTLPDDTRYYLSSVRYFCNEGFVLVGRGHLVCDVDERWNGPPPRCEAVLCRSPPPVAHGGYMLSNNSTIFGTRAEYVCEPGFKLAGTPTLVCQASGFWDGEAPVCQQDPDATQASHVSTVRVSYTPSTSSPTTRYTTTTTTTTTTTEPPPPLYQIDEDPVLPEEKEPLPPPPPIYTRHPPSPAIPASPEPPQVFNPGSSSNIPYEPSTEGISTGSPTRPNAFPTWRPNYSTTRTPAPTPGHATTPRYNPGPTKKRQREEEAMATTAKLNMGGIIALGVFGGFVFLAAIITVIVIIVRRSRNKHQRSGSTSDSQTVSTFDGGSHDTHGLHKYYRRAWDNLRYEGRHLKEDLARQETLDHPHVRGGGPRPCVDELPVSEATGIHGTGRTNPARDWYHKQLGSRTRLH